MHIMNGGKKDFLDLFMFHIKPSLYECKHSKEQFLTCEVFYRFHGSIYNVGKTNITVHDVAKISQRDEQTLMALIKYLIIKY